MSHLPVRRLLAGSIALAAPLTLPALPAAAAPAAAPAPRHCLAEFTDTAADGVVTAFVYTDRVFGAVAYDGWTMTARPRFVEPLGVEVEGSRVTMTSLVATQDGTLQSVQVSVDDVGGVVGGQRAGVRAAEPGARWTPGTPVTIGRGWHHVRDVAVPMTEGSPYMFALLGDRLNRYSLGADTRGHAVVKNGPHAATNSFSSVRSITWSRETTVHGVPADVLLGLDGDRLVEYTVPRKVNPRVTTRVLGARGWRPLTRVEAGACFTNASDSALITRSTPILGLHGRFVKFYLDRDNRDGSGADLANYGTIGRRS